MRGIPLFDGDLEKGLGAWKPGVVDKDRGRSGSRRKVIDRSVDLVPLGDVDAVAERMLTLRRHRLGYSLSLLPIKVEEGDSVAFEAKAFSDGEADA